MTQETSLIYLFNVVLSLLVQLTFERDDAIHKLDEAQASNRVDATAEVSYDNLLLSSLFLIK